MITCPFCRIATHQPSSSTVLESKLAVAFLDIRPIHPGHALIVSRRHEPDFWSLTQEEHHEILALAKRLADAQRKLFNPRKVGLLVVGFDIPHAHLHVVPLHEIHDVTTDAILKGTLKTASAGELAELQDLYVHHFLAEG